MKKAIVAVSFGTSCLRARRAIELAEMRLRNDFKEYDLYRAFTSRMIIRKIAKEEQIAVSSLPEVLDELFRDGYEEVLCQSLHIIKGEEYHKTRNEILSFRDKFRILKFGQPLLNAEEDYTACCRMLREETALSADEGVVFMGHGTEHEADVCYDKMQRAFTTLCGPQWFIGTVEGKGNLDCVLKELEKTTLKKIRLVPFMLVAGEHARNDMAGGEDSWRARLEKRGYACECCLTGLGEREKLVELFSMHLRNAEVL